MVFSKPGQVVVPSAHDADKGDFAGCDLLQGLTVSYGYQPVAGTVHDIHRAVHLSYPQIRTEMITQHEAQRQYGKKALHHAQEIIEGRVKDQVTWFVVSRYLSSKATAEAAT